jgi:hypothetical protein
MPDLDRLIGQQFHRLAGQELPVPPAEAVMRRGRQRRRRARRRAISAIAAVAAAVTAIAVSQLAASPAARRPPLAGHSRHAPAGRALGCPAAPSTLLATELTTGLLPISRQQGVRPIAISQNGATLYVLTTTQGFHGIAEESVHSGAILDRIMSLPSNYIGVQGGLGPGGALIWTSTYDTRSEFGSLAPVRMWSPRTGSVTTLEPNGQHGAPLSPPALSGLGSNLAAWELADGRQQEIVEANLTTGVTDVIARGFLGPPVFVGTALVWSAASQRNGQQTHLVAVSAAVFPASQPIAVPPALSSFSQAVVYGYGATGPWVPAASVIASYGDAVVYASPGLTKLYYSPSASQPARLVLTLTGGNTVSPGSLFVGPGYAGWGTATAASYLTSTVSLAVLQVINGTTAWGGLQGLGDHIMVATFKPTKKPHLTKFHLVSGSTVGALKCAASR